MGKRKPVVVLSSSSEDEVQIRSARRSKGPRKSTSKSFSISRKRTREIPLKEGDDGGSDLRHSRKAEVNRFATLAEDFCDCLQDFDLTRGNQCTNCKELWVEKYTPSSVAQLAVHKKKGRFNNVLILTGQAGVGKSATVRVIASQLGAQLCEWTTPTPTLWQEHVHNVNSGLRYMSKLDEFEVFVEKIGKYSLLPIDGASSRGNVVLIDDLPATNGRHAFERLKKCLSTLTSSSQLPTIILITEFPKIEVDYNLTHHCEELISLLERSGAHKVAFNPLTVNSIKKVLSMLCQEEKCNVTPVQMDQIAKASGGDIRNAITSLQYWGLRPDNLLVSPSTLMEINAKLDTVSYGISPSTGHDGLGELNGTYLQCGKDETLGLFHALGKFLHNKREVMDEHKVGSEIILKDKFARKPLKMESPEKVFSQTYGQARPVIDFLHENVLDFISDGAIEDAWLVTSYLSEADCYLGRVYISRTQIFNDMYESQNLSQSVASSVAIRGILFGNSQPLSSRWHAIRSPRLWQIENSAKQNMNQMLKERFDSFSSLSSSLSEIITEYKPSAQWLSSQTTAHNRDKLEKRSIDEIHFPGRSYSDDLEENSFKGESEDDIEDW